MGRGCNLQLVALKVVVLQTALREELRRLIREIEELMVAARRYEPDIALLPEAWVSLDPLNHLDKALTESADALRKLCGIAAEHGVYILSGGLYAAMGGEVLVSCPVIDPSGDVIGSHEKVHLYGPENDLLGRGEKFRTFNIKGVEIGVLICHDIAYPEAARALVLGGAEILFNPARIASRGGEAWHLYLKVRSLENRTPIYAANVWSPPKYLGGSCGVRPVHYSDEIYLPEVIEARPGISILVDEVDLDYIRVARRKRLAGRVPHAYLNVKGGNAAGEAN